MTASSASNGNSSGDNTPRSIILNFRSIFVGRLLSALSMWLALVMLAKLSDPATVGVYALAQAICIPVGETAKMGLREVRSSDTTGVFRFGDYVGLRFLAALTALLLMVASGILQSDTHATLLVIVLYALSRCAELVSDIIYGLFQAHERMDHIGRSLCLIGPLSLLFLTLGYWLSGSLVIAVLGQLLAHAAVLAFHDIPVARKGARRHCWEGFNPIWDRDALRRLALLASPLAFATMLIMIALYLPRVTVQEALGLSALGLFAAILALAMAPDRLVHSLGIAISVRLARRYAAGKLDSFVRLLGGMVLGVAFFGTLGVLVCAAFGETILGLVYTEAYAEQSDLLVWLVAAASLRLMANVLQFGIVASRRFWWIALQNGIVTVVSVASCLTLIPRFGLTGAGLAMLLIFSAQLAAAGAGLLTCLRAARQSGVTT